MQSPDRDVQMAPALRKASRKRFDPYTHTSRAAPGGRGCVRLVASLPLLPPTQLLTWSGCSSDFLNDLMQYTMGTNKVVCMFRGEKLVPAKKGQGRLRIVILSWEKKL